VLRRRASHPRKPICTVIRNANRPGLFAEPNERSVAQRESRAIENVELLKQQKRDRLAEIERSPADPAEEILAFRDVRYTIQKGIVAYSAH